MSNEPINPHPDGFVSAMKVVHRPMDRRRSTRRCSRILRSDEIHVSSEPVTVGMPQEKIQIVPIMENGRIKALKAVCSCGSESTYDIQYAEPEAGIS